MQDYKSLREAVMIYLCHPMVNTQTHTYTQTDSFWPVILLAQLASMLRKTLEMFC